MAEYGVGIGNMFDLLGDEDGAPVKPRAAPKPKETAPVKKATNNKRAGAAAGRSGGKPRRGGRDGRDNRRGGGRRGGKREFDRRSGTGRGKEGKKDGHGRFNWGNEQDFDGEPNENRRSRRPQRKPRHEAEAATEEKVVAEGENATEDKAPEDGTEAKDDEPEPMSYEEYLESLKAKRVDGDDHQTREVRNDGFQGKASKTFAKDFDEEESLWADAFEEEKESGKRKGKKKNKKKNQKVSLDQFVANNKPRRDGRGGRGGRGGPRDNRNRGKFNLTDSDFPTLGA